MKVEYSKRAVSDLRKIADYHRRSDNPVIGERIATRRGGLGPVIEILPL
jgi:plasmid stabilization system protein ParE